MNTEKETDSQLTGGEAAPADDVGTGQDPKDGGKSPADFIARAEAELAERDKEPQEREKTPAAAPKAQSAQQTARRNQTDKMISGWPEADRKLFASAPENLQELLSRHYRNFQSDYTKKTQQAAALRAAAERDLQELRPLIAGKYRDMRHFASYVSDMQNFERELRRDPLHTLFVLAQHTGVNLGDLAGYRPDAAAEALRPVQAQLAQLQQLLRDRTQGAAAQTPPAQPDGGEAAAAAAFADATDENGQKTHPYFNELAPMMAYIMRRDGHEDMEKAYQEALYTLPRAREELLEKERSAAAAKQAEVERAKRAAALQTRAEEGAHTAGNRKKKIEDIIAQAEEELAGQ